jgi:hypothetical protein
MHPEVGPDLPNCCDDEEHRQDADHCQPADHGGSRPTAETFAGAISMTGNQRAESGMTPAELLELRTPTSALLAIPEAEEESS